MNGSLWGDPFGNGIATSRGKIDNPPSLPNVFVPTMPRVIAGAGDDLAASPIPDSKTTVGMSFNRASDAA